MVCRMNNVGRGRELGEVLSQMRSVFYQCSKSLSLLRWVGVKFIGTRVWQIRVPFKIFFYRARITKTGGVGGVGRLEVEYAILDFQENYSLVTEPGS